MFNVGNDYCPLNFSEVTGHAFCTKTPPITFVSQPGSVHSNTPCGTELLLSSPNVDVTKCSFPLYPIKIILRSNVFKPLQFNENQIHCILSTIGSQEGDQCQRSTHSVWIGPSKNFFKFAALIVVNELNYLQNRVLPDGKPCVVYHCKWKWLVRVSTKVYACMCIQTDNAKDTCTPKGGFCGNRCGFIGKLHQIVHMLVPRKICYRRTLDQNPVGSQEVPRYLNGCFASDHDKAVYKAD